jgi:hypothetical protein
MPPEHIAAPQIDMPDDICAYNAAMGEWPLCDADMRQCGTGSIGAGLPPRLRGRPVVAEYAGCIIGR